MTTRQKVPGTDLGFDSPVQADVWNALVSAHAPLPVVGPLMTMLAHDQGMPEMVGARTVRRYTTEHYAGFDYGTYPATNACDPLVWRDLDDAGVLVMTYPRIFVNAKELPC